jgi:effector-binding domain-containing protein
MMAKDNVKVVQANLNRNYFTQHSIHLNANGKDKTVELIKQTLNILKRKQEVSNSIKMDGDSYYLIHNELKDKTPNQSASIKTTVAAEVAASKTASKTTEKGDS